MNTFSSLFFFLAVFLPLHQVPTTHAWMPPMPKLKLPENIGRRGAIGRLVSLTTGAITAAELTQPEPSEAADNTIFSSQRVHLPLPSPSSFDAYYITPVENEVRSKLDKIDSKKFINEMATHSGGSIWLGEHHNSASDHTFQAMVIREVHRERAKNLRLKDTPMAVGLEQVQGQFQPVLDAYINGKISLNEMKSLVQWDERWSWSFENYKEIFVVAKDLGIRLLALNVDSEDLVLVEQEGYPGLPPKQLHKYIKDPIGFADFAMTSEFKTYNDYVIKPSYELHQRLGLLQYTVMGEQMESEMTFGRFFSGRTLWDEGMASSAFSWCVNNPGGLLVGLVGADHVKFENGVPGRFSRMARSSNSKSNNQVDTITECKAVVINPTLIDSRPSGTVSRIPTSDSAEYPERVTLQLRYTKAAVDLSPPNTSGANGVLSFSDYVVVT
mmetsp:Transcript_615/g.1401  ORF Transcript_615/g.1401 Transcript_615/m.1401 type:complete len:441 (-) Transcript_615:112-1434(-)|eukprot:CAMPEP_0168218872 /NCGR_PEP_ID=MMETSP0140_2-20121125/8189_1 /TAXON_ID=44445 /ORGANISM="Pseudo-nitzschia australis, Strain 10249 10 AB" /LENGTH=440 /DNA_ID=CAMNT_0008147077 /DNA_START=309 /DNA_END=1631 /DNA_ORIENTATION=+